MIELSRHIESLMLTHDCVIVPGLGGFVTQYVPARRVDDEQLFLPPYRSVGFNRRLTLNDGLLVQSYMQAYDTNYPETVKLIEEAVGQLKETLRQEGEYELSGIGRLTLGIDGGYRFEPLEAGVLSPELYALDSFVLPTIDNTDKDTNDSLIPAIVKGRRRRPSVKRAKRHYTISVSRELVNYVAAAVVAVCFYFIWGTPVDSNETAYRQAAGTIYENIFARPERAAAPAPAVEIIARESVPSTADTTALTASVAETPAPAPTETKEQPIGAYTIVLASAITQQNAEDFVETLKQEGLNEAEVYKRGKMVRVVYGAYADAEAAANALQDLRKRSRFAEAWILEK